MKKIISLALVLILTMSVALTASAAGAEDFLGGATLEVPQFASIGEAFDALADFLKLEPIMSYAPVFHQYMDGVYRELDSLLKSAAPLINGFLSALLYATR